MVRKTVPQKIKNLSIHFPKALAANIKYGFPGRKLKVIGVTGTDGKTTTVNLIFKILKDAGKSVSMISTINAEIGGKSYDTGFHITTPSPFDIQKYLNLSLKNKDEYMVLEVTSHSLDQFRVWGVKFEVGVITNITHEHLDYHKSYQKYLEAKAKLIKSSNWAVLNRDDPGFQRLIKLTKSHIKTFGLKTNSDINRVNFPLNLKLTGEYNLYNAYATAAVGLILGLDKKIIKKSLENFSGLEGRMEEIENNLGIKIIVDFAHTPNALEQALKTLKPQSKGRLISVFGCASQRDILKRPQMGKISGKFSDITILTDEDPRFEDSLKIINEISVGAIKSGAKLDKNLFFEPDRKEAIRIAVEMAKKGDIIGIFGKGHEKSMNYKGTEREWSDQRAVREIISTFKN